MKTSQFLGFIVIFALVIMSSCSREFSEVCEPDYLFEVGWADEEGHQYYTYGDSLRVKSLKYPWAYSVYRVSVFHRGLKKMDVYHPNSYFQVRDTFSRRSNGFQ